jgi:hypothetical protein
VADEVVCQLACTRELWEPMRRSHEGYALMLARLDELWEAVKEDRAGGDPDAMRLRMRRAAIGVATMAIQFVTDCCTEEE